MKIYGYHVASTVCQMTPPGSSSWEKEALLGSDSHGRTWEEAGLGRQKCHVVLEIQQSLLRSNKEVQGQACVERSLMLTEMAGPLHSLSGWDRPQKTVTSGIPSELTARRCQLTTFLRTGKHTLVKPSCCSSLHNHSWSRRDQEASRWISWVCVLPSASIV